MPMNLELPDAFYTLSYDHTDFNAFLVLQSQHSVKYQMHSA